MAFGTEAADDVDVTLEVRGSVVGAGHDVERSGTSQTRSLAWPRPASGAGCYCVRGTVMDAAMQSTTVIASKAVWF